MTSHNKKRKYQEETRNVKSEWEEDFAYINKNGKALCHSCIASLCHHQGSTERNMNVFVRILLKSISCKNKHSTLQLDLRGQKTLLSSFIKEMMQPPKLVLLFHGPLPVLNFRRTDREIVRKNIAPVISVPYQNNSELQRPITESPVSYHTTKRLKSVLILRERCICETT
jgi:hypothetical protein